MSHPSSRFILLLSFAWGLLLSPVCEGQDSEASPNLQVDPPALHFEPDPGAPQTLTLRLFNPTDQTLSWTLSERSESAAPASVESTVTADVETPSSLDHANALEALAAVDWTRPHGPDTLIVGFRQHGPGAAAARQSAHREAGGALARSFRLIPADVVRIPPGRSLQAVAMRYARRPDVDFVSPSYTLRHCATPNDARFAEQWNLDNGASTGGAIAASQAWAIAHSAEDVIIAILDTGIDLPHPDLSDNLWRNPAESPNGQDDDGNGIVDDIHGARWVNGDGTVTNGNPQDGHGHGTHVAGIAGAVGNNGIGVAGVAWRVQLMALKMLKDSGDGQDADAVAAIEYAVENGARIINASWGTSNRTPALQQAIQAAGQAGVLFVTAAGNSNSNNDQVDYFPSNYGLANIITVANSTSTDGKYISSNYGRTRVHLAAPGVGILSCRRNGLYGQMTGTSMSTPHVAGVAALLLNQAPDATLSEWKGWILDGVDSASAWSGLTVTGGRLNAARSLAFVHVPWLHESIRAGTLAPGETVTIAITAQAPDEPADALSWTARLIVAETDSGQRTEIPVTMDVTAPGPAGYWLMSSAPRQ